MLNNKLLPIVSLISLGYFVPIYADGQFQDTRWYAAPYATFVLTDEDRHAANGFGGGMGLGKILDEHFNIELNGFYQGYSTTSAWSMSGGSADLQFYFSREKFSPYTVIGFGGMNSCLGTNSGVSCAPGIIGEMGLGFSYELDDNLLIRSDVRYRYNNNHHVFLQTSTSDYSDMIFNVGFVIPFGEKPKPAAARTETPQPAQADCSTRDSDADGVNDCLDKCPNTPKGGKVDPQGCLIKLVLKGQHFKFDSAQLTQEARQILDNVAAGVIAYPEKNDIEVQGYASSEGNDAYNLKLSLNRAESVVDYLKAKGVTNRLAAKGFGKSHPVADNGTIAGRSENRRVELILIRD